MNLGHDNVMKLSGPETHCVKAKPHHSGFDSSDYRYKCSVDLFILGPAWQKKKAVLSSLSLKHLSQMRGQSKRACT